MRLPRVHFFRYYQFCQKICRFSHFYVLHFFCPVYLFISLGFKVSSNALIQIEFGTLAYYTNASDALFQFFDIFIFVEI